jgi:flavin reductase (DIM6/NTAB) family NADH-FMN oxidoreductase RutF
MAEIDLKDLRRGEAYGLMISFIVPRAIALVSTKDARGHINVAPFSYFTGLGSDPPMVTLGIANRRDGREKDTLRIARETGVFCVNLVEEPLAAKMNLASGDFEPEVSELEVAGFTAAPCVAIDGVRLQEARASIECRLVDVHTYGRAAKTNLLVAEVLHAFIADEILAGDGKSIDPERIAPLARLGGSSYAKLGERFSLPRPKPT